MLTLGSIFRPSMAVALYLLSYFMSPGFWWWGTPIADYRWNLYAGITLLISVLLNGFNQSLERPIASKFVALTMMVVLNATFVHYLLAPNLEISSVRYFLLLKIAMLFILMTAAIRDNRDLQIVLISIVLGACYLGFEVTINDRGRLVGNRLEGVGVPNAASANDLACLVVSILPLTIPLLLAGNLREKLVSILSAPLALNVVMKCNSRGAFLALIGSGLVFLACAPRGMRIKALQILGLGVFVFWMLLGDARIVDRFWTTFASESERDGSATGRLQFWKAGIKMIADHPLGSGGDGFKRVRGQKYISQVVKQDAVARSVHQGYINEACEWGLQGLALRIAILFGGAYVAWTTAKRAIDQNEFFIATVCLSVTAGLAGLCGQSLFGTFFDDEWGFWLVALSIGCEKILHDNESSDSESAIDGRERSDED